MTCSQSEYRAARSSRPCWRCRHLSSFRGLPDADPYADPNEIVEVRLILSGATWRRLHDSYEAFAAANFTARVCILARASQYHNRQKLGAAGVPVPMVLERVPANSATTHAGFHRGTTVGDPYFDRISRGCVSWAAARTTEAGWCRVLDNPIPGQGLGAGHGWRSARHIRPYLPGVRHPELPAFQPDVTNFGRHPLGAVDRRAGSAFGEKFADEPTGQEHRRGAPTPIPPHCRRRQAGDRREALVERAGRRLLYR